MKLTNLKAGDRVRLTLEMEVDSIDGHDGEVTFTESGGNDLYFTPGTDDDAIVSIEKLTTLRPGDIVRGKHGGTIDFVLMKQHDAETFDYFAGGKLVPAGYFTPNDYEIVASVEVAK